MLFISNKLLAMHNTKENTKNNHKLWQDFFKYKIVLNNNFFPILFKFNNIQSKLHCR
jgi:hypothetical protein